MIESRTEPACAGGECAGALDGAEDEDNMLLVVASLEAFFSRENFIKSLSPKTFQYQYYEYPGKARATPWLQPTRSHRCGDHSRRRPRLSIVASSGEDSGSGLVGIILIVLAILVLLEVQVRSSSLNLEDVIDEDELADG